MNLGRSGDYIHVLPNRVVKTSFGERRHRLREACAKQHVFWRRREHEGLTTPRVFGEHEWDTKRGPCYGFAMAPVPWHPRFWYRAVEPILAMVHRQYAQVPRVHVPAAVFYGKIDSVVSLLPPEKRPGDAFRYCRQAFARGASLHCGPAHGDLTFCNVLAGARAVYLVDFSTQFTDALLLDVVRLRQDTKHRWAAMIAPSTSDLIPSDDPFGALLKELPDAEWYAPLQVLNLTRILPYVQHEPQVFRHLEEQIRCLISSS